MTERNLTPRNIRHESRSPEKHQHQHHHKPHHHHTARRTRSIPPQRHHKSNIQQQNPHPERKRQHRNKPQVTGHRHSHRRSSPHSKRQRHNTRHHTPHLTGLPTPLRTARPHQASSSSRPRVSSTTSTGRSVAVATHSRMRRSWPLPRLRVTRIMTRPGCRSAVPWCWSAWSSPVWVVSVGWCGRCRPCRHRPPSPLVPQCEHQLRRERAAGLLGVEVHAVAAAGVHTKRELLAELTGQPADSQRNAVVGVGRCRAERADAGAERADG